MKIKMMMRKRGQGALEYMMTYGWVILVIVIVGVVMWQMGIFQMGKIATPGKSGFSQVMPLDWSLYKGGDNLTIILVNDAGMRLNVSSVNATIISGGTGTCPNTISSDIEMLPAGTYKISITCGGGIEDELGDYFRVEVGIVYENPSSGLSHNSVGKLWGPIE